MGFWSLFQLSLSNHCTIALQFQPTTNQQISLCLLWEEDGEFGEPPDTEILQTPIRRKSQGLESNPQPSYCQVNVLTVSAPSSPGPVPSLQVSSPLFLFSLFPFPQHHHSLSLSSPLILSLLQSPLATLRSTSCFFFISCSCQSFYSFLFRPSSFGPSL